MVLFSQFVDDDLGCASYLCGDQEVGKAYVVDPAYAIEQYLQAAEQHGVRIVGVLETHTHADHVSGHGRLAIEHGIPVHVHPAAEPAFPFQALRDDQELEAGGLTLRVLHTPGHRPEHCCFAAAEWILTGDSLFVGDAARPDLAIDPRDGATALFHSLRRLAGFPATSCVYPGHVAGSLCGTAMSSQPSSTIGAELRSNPALAHTGVGDFVNSNAVVSAPRPPTMRRVVELNRGPFLGARPTLEQRAEVGAHPVLDVRPAELFAVGHVAGAINVPVSGTSFGTRTGFLCPADSPLVLHASSREEALLAATRLQAVGFLELAGYVLEINAPETLEPVELDDLERLLAHSTVELVDVREQDERDEGFIPGSRHVPYRLVGECCAALGDRPVVTICESGARAAIAASVLVAHGIDARPVLHGGIPDWPGQTVEFRRCGRR